MGAANPGGCTRGVGAGNCRRRTFYSPPNPLAVVADTRPVSAVMGITGEEAW